MGLTRSIVPDSDAEILTALVAADGSSGGFLKDSQLVVGTWTPVITFATPGDLSVTYSTQIGRYERIGDYVTLDFTLGTSAFTHTTAANALRITGSPFTAVANTGDRHTGTLSWRGITKANYTHINTTLSENSAIIEALACGSGQSATGVTAADMPTGGTVLLRGNIRFPVA